MNICPENLCTGCGACISACPKNAISLQSNDSIASNTAVINNSLCIECMLCKKICPVNKKIQLNPPLKCYALWAKDIEEQKSCASAGAVTSLYKVILDNDGIVFGTCFENGKLIFKAAQTYEEGKCFKGSKYIQAIVGNAYKDAETFLKDNKTVLFVGTPCQIAGLKNYLRNDYQNLLTVDLICHGIPYQKYFSQYINSILSKNKYDNVEFRGINGLKLAVYNKNKTVYLKPKSEDYYYTAYLKGLIHRENCYNCYYSSINRCADITAGDFWGLKINELKNKTLKTNTPSLVLVNTEKGKKLFEAASVYFDAEERTLEEATSNNKQLLFPCQKSPEREKFLNNIVSNDFITAVKSTYIGKTVSKNKIKAFALFPYKFVKKTVKKALKHFR